MLEIRDWGFLAQDGISNFYDMRLKMFLLQNNILNSVGVCCVFTKVI